MSPPIASFNKVASDVKKVYFLLTNFETECKKYDKTEVAGANVGVFLRSFAALECRTPFGFFYSVAHSFINALTTKTYVRNAVLRAISVLVTFVAAPLGVYFHDQGIFRAPSAWEVIANKLLYLDPAYVTENKFLYAAYAASAGVSNLGSALLGGFSLVCNSAFESTFNTVSSGPLPFFYLAAYYAIGIKRAYNEFQKVPGTEILPQYGEIVPGLILANAVAYTFSRQAWVFGLTCFKPDDISYYGIKSVKFGGLNIWLTNSQQQVGLYLKAGLDFLIAEKQGPECANGTYSGLQKFTYRHHTSQLGPVEVIGDGDPQIWISKGNANREHRLKEAIVRLYETLKPDLGKNMPYPHMQSDLESTVMPALAFDFCKFVKSVVEHTKSTETNNPFKIEIKYLDDNGMFLDQGDIGKFAEIAERIWCDETAFRASLANAFSGKSTDRDTLGNLQRELDNARKDYDRLLNQTAADATARLQTLAIDSDKNIGELLGHRRQDSKSDIEYLNTLVEESGRVNFKARNTTDLLTLSAQLNQISSGLAFLDGRHTDVTSAVAKNAQDCTKNFDEHLREKIQATGGPSVSSKSYKLHEMIARYSQNAKVADIFFADGLEKANVVFYIEGRNYVLLPDGMITRAGYNYITEDVIAKMFFRVDGYQTHALSLGKFWNTVGQLADYLGRRDHEIMNPDLSYSLVIDSSNRLTLNFTSDGLGNGRDFAHLLIDECTKRTGGKGKVKDNFPAFYEKVDMATRMARIVGKLEVLSEEIRNGIEELQNLPKGPDEEINEPEDSPSNTIKKDVAKKMAESDVYLAALNDMSTQKSAPVLRNTKHQFAIETLNSYIRQCEGKAVGYQNGVFGYKRRALGFFEKSAIPGEITQEIVKVKETPTSRYTGGFDFLQQVDAYVQLPVLDLEGGKSQTHVAERLRVFFNETRFFLQGSPYSIAIEDESFRKWLNSIERGFSARVGGKETNLNETTLDDMGADAKTFTDEFGYRMKCAALNQIAIKIFSGLDRTELVSTSGMKLSRNFDAARYLGMHAMDLITTGVFATLLVLVMAFMRARSVNRASESTPGTPKETQGTSESTPDTPKETQGTSESTPDTPKETQGASESTVVVPNSVKQYCKSLEKVDNLLVELNLMKKEDEKFAWNPDIANAMFSGIWSYQNKDNRPLFSTIIRVPELIQTNPDMHMLPNAYTDASFQKHCGRGTIQWRRSILASVPSQIVDETLLIICSQLIQNKQEVPCVSAMPCVIYTLLIANGAKEEAAIKTACECDFKTLLRLYAAIKISTMYSSSKMVSGKFSVWFLNAITISPSELSLEHDVIGWLISFKPKAEHNSRSLQGLQDLIQDLYRGFSITKPQETDFAMIASFMIQFLVLAFLEYGIHSRFGNPGDTRRRMLRDNRELLNVTLRSSTVPNYLVCIGGYLWGMYCMYDIGSTAFSQTSSLADTGGTTGLLLRSVGLSTVANLSFLGGRALEWVSRGVDYTPGAKFSHYLFGHDMAEMSIDKQRVSTQARYYLKTLDVAQTAAIAGALGIGSAYLGLMASYPHLQTEIKNIVEGMPSTIRSVQENPMVMLSSPGKAAFGVLAGSIAKVFLDLAIKFPVAHWLSDSSQETSFTLTEDSYGWLLFICTMYYNTDSTYDEQRIPAIEFNLKDTKGGNIVPSNGQISIGGTKLQRLLFLLTGQRVQQVTISTSEQQLIDSQEERLANLMMNDLLRSRQTTPDNLRLICTHLPVSMIITRVIWFIVSGPISSINAALSMLVFCYNLKRHVIEGGQVPVGTPGFDKFGQMNSKIEHVLLLATIRVLQLCLRRKVTLRKAAAEAVLPLTVYAINAALVDLNEGQDFSVLASDLSDAVLAMYVINDSFIPEGLLELDEQKKHS